ncbi:MAG: hypothetical protein RLZ12_134 [Bacillota bacterium]
MYKGFYDKNLTISATQDPFHPELGEWLAFLHTANWSTAGAAIKHTMEQAKSWTKDVANEIAEGTTGLITKAFEFLPDSWQESINAMLGEEIPTDQVEKGLTGFSGAVDNLYYLMLPESIQNRFIYKADIIQGITALLYIMSANIVLMGRKLDSTLKKDRLASADELRRNIANFHNVQKPCLYYLTLNVKKGLYLFFSSQLENVLSGLSQLSNYLQDIEAQISRGQETANIAQLLFNLFQGLGITIPGVDQTFIEMYGQPVPKVLKEEQSPRSPQSSIPGFSDEGSSIESFSPRPPQTIDLFSSFGSSIAPSSPQSSSSPVGLLSPGAAIPWPASWPSGGSDDDFFQTVPTSSASSLTWEELRRRAGLQ